MNINTPNIMKKLIILLLLFTVLVNAQIVNIPDANFKNRLVNTICVDTNNDSTYDADADTNNDGEIQVSEAFSITRLNVSGIYNGVLIVPSLQISNMLGIESFVNLQYLNCNYNQLTNLDVSINLELTYLECSNNLLNSLTTFNNILLKTINCSYNSLASINIVNNNFLSALYINNNLLSNLNISSNLNLKSLNCGSNLITELNLFNNTLLDTLDCYDNLLTNLDISNLFLLQGILMSKNQITNFTFPNPLNLYYFNCSFNNLSQIDVSKITCDNYDFSNNPNLTYINMKNGHQDGCLVLLAIGMDYICSRFLGLPNLQFICVDEGEASGWTIPSNININSYCSFSPGGNYNTITGTIKFDSNSNGCDVNDPIISNVKINITDGTNSGSTYTNNQGVYNFYSVEPTLNLSPVLENPTYFTASPSNVAVNFPNGSLGQTFNQDFCITANGIHPDLEVVLAPITTARPGFDAAYKLVYKNKGNQTLSGTVNLVFDDAKTDLVSANPAVDN